MKCKKPRRNREVKDEAHIAQIPDGKLALLMIEREIDKKIRMLINEEGIVPKLSQDNNEKHMDSIMWYLDNGASNHMMGQYSKFDKLDDNVTD